MDTTRITKLLNDVRGGNRGAERQLIELIYPELRKIAARQLRAERPGHTLQPTALVHEAYLRLAGQQQVWQNRSHFFAVAAQLMYAILVDYGRRRQAAKRGSGAARIELGGLPVAANANANAEYILDVDRAIEKLAGWDPRQAKVVVFRFFGGLNEDEIAEVLSVSVRTVKRDWRMAKAWLHGELGGRSSGHDG
ncbi:MAG TPA: sigma-70 family RNA polymerase sigma factor [Bryobacteraceae bacterium]|nr:sigma-70 family RNA polymerase sigma factor [Bryobacteraceae bacterium]